MGEGTKIPEENRENKTYLEKLMKEYPDQVEEYEPGKFRPTREGWGKINTKREEFEEEARQFTEFAEASYKEGKNPLPEIRNKWPHGQVHFAYSPDRPLWFFGGRGEGKTITSGLEKGEVDIIANYLGDIMVVLGNREEDILEDYV